MEVNLTPIIEESFTQYAAAVTQSRALVDVRDCIKPSARQIFYSMLRNKYTWDKPHEKTLAPAGDAGKELYPRRCISGRYHDARKSKIFDALSSMRLQRQLWHDGCIG